MQVASLQVVARAEPDLMDLEVRILKSIFRGGERDCTAELALWNATVPTDEQVGRIPRVLHDLTREMIGSIGGQPRHHGLEITTGSRLINEYRMLLANVKEACLFTRDRRRVRP